MGDKILTHLLRKYIFQKTTEQKQNTTNNFFFFFFPIFSFIHTKNQKSKQKSYIFFIFPKHFLFCSATWPREVQSLARSFLNKPVQINVGDSNKLVVNANIQQEVVVLDKSDKRKKLLEVLESLPKECKRHSSKIHPKYILLNYIIIYVTNQNLN